MNVFVPQLQIHKFDHSLTHFVLNFSKAIHFVNFLISFKIKVINLTLCNKIVSMLNISTFDVFSDCHSLGQSVTGIALFIFVLIP